MRPVRKIKIWWALFLAMPFLILNAGHALAADDVEAPDVTARVARISFLSGDVQIKRVDGSDWERATGNLPIVEGDEIATEAGARLEIQFDSESFLRLSENAYLKVTTLRDEGIALSLPNGSISLRVLNFDKDREFFEIDAPRTTVSVEKSGMYRVDSGDRNDAAVRIAVTEFGQARVYSENSGFTVKNGRRATIQIEGDYAGEWETADAAKFADDFDDWVLQRDALIAKRLQKADYDKYYDRDFYGAEDLSEYGEWIYTKKYGYVWRPYRDSVSSYADWSPYRYGQWRWIPPYGWTWVNDEPWGWATYHRGRWIHDSGYWYWSPYPQSRGRRSWWRPALVVISYVADNICWYPLPYHYGYYNYNRYYVDRRRYNTTIINNTTVVVNPTPNPTPAPVIGTLQTSSPKVKVTLLPAESVPTTGVVTVAAGDFGRNKGNFRPAGSGLAVRVLSEAPSETVRPATLPTFRDLKGRVSREILAENPRSVRPAMPIRTGAIERTEGVSMGENLRRTRILGGRPPVESTPPSENTNGMETQSPIRGTGAVRRQPRTETSTGSEETPVRSLPRSSGGRIREPIRSTGDDNESEPRIQPPSRSPRNNDAQENAPPVYNPPPRQERLEPPRRERQEPVRPEPPREERRLEPPRRVEPRREEPRREETPRLSPPPPSQETPPEQKIAPSRKIVTERDQ